MPVASSAGTEECPVNVRYLFRNEGERQAFIDNVELDTNEILVEAVDRYAHDHALLMSPTCPDALVVGKHTPELKSQGDRAVTALRTLYVARSADAVKILMSQTGKMDLSPSRCLVVRQAA